MAFLSINTTSECLKMTTLINVILPDIVRMDKPMSKRKTLYLLHGLSDNATMWQRRSMIENYAEKYGIVVVMPSGDRSFYLDNCNGQDYYSYISKELPQYMNKVFNLSLKKEDNFIAGLSMGGYGAMRIALLNSDNYFAVGSFSAPFDVVSFLINDSSRAFGTLPFLNGQKIDIETSDLVPNNLLRSAKNDMKIYVSCGLQDDLLGSSKLFESVAKENGVKARFEYSDGAHEWFFWNREIAKFIDFALE